MNWRKRIKLMEIGGKMKKKTLATLLFGATVLGSGLAGLTGCGSPVTHHDAIPATCYTTGNIEYWKKAGRFYSDDQCQTEIQENETVLAKISHSFNDGVCSHCGNAQMQDYYVQILGERPDGDYDNNTKYNLPALNMFGFTTYDAVKDKAKFSSQVPLDYLVDLTAYASQIATIAPTGWVFDAENSVLSGNAVNELTLQVRFKLTNLTVGFEGLTGTLPAKCGTPIEMLPGIERFVPAEKEGFDFVGWAYLPAMTSYVNHAGSTLFDREDYTDDIPFRAEGTFVTLSPLYERKTALAYMNTTTPIVPATEQIQWQHSSLATTSVQTGSQTFDEKTANRHIVMKTTTSIPENSAAAFNYTFTRNSLNASDVSACQRMKISIFVEAVDTTKANEIGFYLKKPGAATFTKPEGFIVNEWRELEFYTNDIIDNLGGLDTFSLYFETLDECDVIIHIGEIILY